MSIWHAIRWPHAVVLGAFLCLAAPMWGQEVSAARGSCAPHGNISRVVDVPARVVYGTLETRDGKASPITMYLATLLQEIAFVFVPPDSTLPLPTYSFTMRLGRDGRLRDVQPGEPYIPRSLAEATIRAIDSVARRGGIGPVFIEMDEDPLPVRMVFRLHDRKRDTNVPFYEIRSPAYFEYETDKPALSIPGNPVPPYPRALREANIEGEVLLQVVVDTMGRADMRTVRVLGSSPVYRELVRSVLSTLPKMRFTPAERGGCKVKQLIHLPFAFRLRRG